jgi:hypothetical protein
MKKVFLLAYSDSLGTREEVKQCLNSLDEVDKWRSDLPHAFYLTSEEDASTLAQLIREKMGKGRFIISEITGYHGWLTPESWYLIKNKKYKPKEEPPS